MAGSGTAHRRSDGSTDLVLAVDHLVVEFPGRQGTVQAVSDVSFDLAAGETLGVVGESGCGKSTTGKAILQVPPPTSGRIEVNGVDLATLDDDELRAMRSRLQMVFQDAASSLNPRRTVAEIVGEPLEIQWLESFPRSRLVRAWERYVPWMLSTWRHRVTGRAAAAAGAAFFAGLLVWVAASSNVDVGADGLAAGGAAASVGLALLVGGLALAAPLVAWFGATAAVWTALTALLPIAGLPRAVRIRRGRAAFQTESEPKVRTVLADVGIDPDAALARRPHEFSGGQAQRISIARALISGPEVVVCDEPVSALDVSVQAQVLNLLEDLKASYGLSLLFIAHDLAVVRSIADRIVVMYLGKVCEVTTADALFAAPLHPYTRALLAAIPSTDPSVDPRRAVTLPGERPSPVDPPSGCRFRTRCPEAADRCAAEEPPVREVVGGHFVACHFAVAPEVGADNGSGDLVVGARGAEGARTGA